MKWVGVKHGQVSRHLFEPLFPRWPTNDVPVGSVTNGVHMPSWDSAIADTVWSNAGGKDRWRGDLTTLEQDIYNTSDESLWQMRNSSRNNLVEYTRKKYVRQLSVSGQSPELMEVAKSVFDPNVLTIGFARRFVPYKRPDLLLHNEERFIRLLTNLEHPVKLVIAGKSPPFDEAGKNLIRKWVQFIQRNNLHKHVVFLSDYDMALTQHLVKGVDVWLNTPRRPWEACGTSGMKVLVNGGINLSELD
ncbi:alpha-glucan family phosphorylase [Mucilaginibacter sp.]|uniref:alpha-glucan family phosphorylase n=1 Tax=Mucilaginibacter sp. TaxID=1882438 RepID=UPI003266CEE4